MHNTGTSGSTSGTFTVDAHDNSYYGGLGLDTGITFVKGQEIHCTASGEWITSLTASLPPQRFGPDGCSIAMDGVVMAAAALAGQIDGAKPFLLGSDITVLAPETGSLKLFCWDGQNNDNSGSISVTIQ